MKRATGICDCVCLGRQADRQRTEQGRSPGGQFFWCSSHYVYVVAVEHTSAALGGADESFVAATVWWRLLCLVSASTLDGGCCSWMAPAMFSGGCCSLAALLLRLAVRMKLRQSEQMSYSGEAMLRGKRFTRHRRDWCYFYLTSGTTVV